jgi:hypothetical protein
MHNIETVTIDGVVYVPQSSTPTGRRAVVVIDRGWIAAGDVSEENGRIHLSRAVWVFNWEGIGFDGVIANPKSPACTIRPFPNGFDIPTGAEIFRVPVADDWGL